MYNPDKFPAFFRVTKEDVTLKFAFDNLRNIGLSALFFALGAIIFKGEPLSSILSIPYSQVVLGALLCLGALALSFFNFLQGVLAILALERFNVFVYSIFAVLMHFATYESFFRLASKQLG